MSIVGPVGLQGPVGRRGPPGEMAFVFGGSGLNSIDIHSNQFVQHRTVNVRRPVIIIEQPIYVFQRITR